MRLDRVRLLWPRDRIEELALLRSLIGDPIETVTGRRVNTIVEVNHKQVRVTTGRSPQGQWVDVRDVEIGLEKLHA